MQDLLLEYKKALKELSKSKQSLNKEEQAIVSGMMSDLRYAIEWMSTGRPPGLRRGIERRAAYQRERMMDPLLIQHYYRATTDEYNWTSEQQESCLAEMDRSRIEVALCMLTEREKEIYLMSRGQMFSYEEIARMLTVSKSTIQTTIQRAEKKIKKQLSKSEFSSVG